MRQMTEEKNSCRFLIFTDLHFAPTWISWDADKRLERIMDRAQEKDVDFVMQLGDFLHEPEQNGWLAGKFLQYGIPKYSALGNHDTDWSDVTDVVNLYNMPKNYYQFVSGGYRFVVLDPNYVVLEGKEEHFAPNQTRPNNRGYIPEAQLKWLAEILLTSEEPCILFSHESLERSDGISNRDAVWKIISEANRRRRHSVILCVNGHYHCDYCCFVNDVCCLDLNSVSYHWTDVKNQYYPSLWYEKYACAAHCMGYDTALSAVVTLKEGGEILVEGCSGGFLFHPDQCEVQRIDQRRLSESRIAVPYISDYKVNLEKLEIQKMQHIQNRI